MKQETSGLAVASLVLSCLSIFLGPLVPAVVAEQIKPERNKTRKVKAMKTATILPSIVLACAALLLANAADAQTPSSGPASGRARGTRNQALLTDLFQRYCDAYHREDAAAVIALQSKSLNQQFDLTAPYAMKPGQAFLPVRFEVIQSSETGNECHMKLDGWFNPDPGRGKEVPGKIDVTFIQEGGVWKVQKTVMDLNSVLKSPKTETQRPIGQAPDQKPVAAVNRTLPTAEFRKSGNCTLPVTSHSGTGAGEALLVTAGDPELDVACHFRAGDFMENFAVFTGPRLTNKSHEPMTVSIHVAFLDKAGELIACATQQDNLKANATDWQFASCMALLPTGDAFQRIASYQLVVYHSPATKK